MTKFETNVAVASQNIVASTVTICAGSHSRAFCCPQAALLTFSLPPRLDSACRRAPRPMSRQGGRSQFGQGRCSESWVLYGLMFLKVLFPRPDIDDLVSPGTIKPLSLTCGGTAKDQ